MKAQQVLECLDYLDANELFDFSDGDVSGSGSDISYDGDLADDSGDGENGAGDGEGPNVVDGDGDDDDDSLVTGRRSSWKRPWTRTSRRQMRRTRKRWTWTRQGTWESSLTWSGSCRRWLSGLERG